jgi:prevent-host-death family protein
VLTSNEKGNIAEAAVALEAIKLGVRVLKPAVEHCRYDLAFDLGERIVRVQCKWGRLDGGVICAHLVGYRTNKTGAVRTTYSTDEIDAVAVYCADTDAVYLIPASEIDGKSAVQLRLRAPRNGQRAAINWAQRYLLSGAVAQLGERRHGMAEVRGSSPLSSTPQTGGERVVGAHEFREKFGYWMERAAAGDEILITRRGRRYARLGPADPQLATTDIARASEPEPDQEEPVSGTARTSS